MFIVMPTNNGYLVTISEKGTGEKINYVANSEMDVIEFFKEYHAKQYLAKKVAGRIKKVKEVTKEEDSDE